MVFTLLLTTSCFSSDHDEDVDESAVLNIYVYAPENPLATRVDDPAPDPVLDPVPAEAEENAIHHPAGRQDFINAERPQRSRPMS